MGRTCEARATGARRARGGGGDGHRGVLGPVTDDAVTDDQQREAAGGQDATDLGQPARLRFAPGGGVGAQAPAGRARADLCALERAAGQLEPGEADVSCWATQS